MITLECNYSKKIGLPGFSSHQFSVTLKTEIADLSQVQSESARLYKLLQTGVDNSIKEIGFLPSSNNGHNSNGDGHNGNGNGFHSSNGTNGNGRYKGNNGSTHEEWACSDKQKNLILKIVEENGIDKRQVEQLAQERFSKGVRSLNKLEASGLIEELLEQYGDPKPKNRFQKARA